MYAKDIVFSQKNSASHCECCNNQLIQGKFYNRSPISGAKTYKKAWCVYCYERLVPLSISYMDLLNQGYDGRVVKNKGKQD